MDFSIVIPALNEQGKIERDIESAAGFLAANRMKGEIIVVDDGSSDDTDGAAESTEVPSEVGKTVIRLEENRGKGCAVRTGVMRSEGEYVLFADSGLCVPFDNVIRGLEMIRSGQCDIAHASRYHPNSTIVSNRGPGRRIMSYIFRKAALPGMVAIPEHLTDTQCGFKLYRGDAARALYAESVIDGFAFDIEIILRAADRGLVIGEFPIEWTNDRDTRLRPSFEAVRVSTDLNRIRKLWSR